MDLDQILVTGFGLSLIAFIFWFFFMKKESAVAARDRVEITVDGGYSPEVITAESGRALTLTFLRKDPSPCLEEVVFSDLGIRRYLPLNERVQITITPNEKRDYVFACGMNMFRGKVVAE